MMKRRQLDVGRIVLGAAILALLILVVYPLGRLVLQSFRFDEGLGVENYLSVLSNPRNYVALRNSLQVSVATMAGATFLGTLAAWVVARTDVPGRGALRTAFVFPFIMPPFISALAWRQIFGPVGYVNQAYRNLTGSSDPLWNFYGADGIIVVLILNLYPLVYITALGGLERMNPELEEVAQISGAGIWKVMRSVTIPLMAPTIASGAVLTFIAAIANFGVPAILGFAENYYVLTTQIWELVARSARANSLSAAAALSVLLAIVAALGLIAQRLLLRRREFTVLSGKSIQPNVVRLRGARWLVFAICAIVILVTSVAPTIAILLTALTRAYGLAPTPDNWTLQNFYYVLFVSSTSVRAIRNSVVLALSAATTVSLLGALIAYIAVKTKLRGRAVIDMVANMPYAIPGTVVAVAMILAWLRPIPGVGLSLYNTLGILFVAYVARYLAFGVRSTAGSLAQVHASLEEAAQISGANWLQTFRDIVVPLIRPGLFAGWFLVFMPALRELTISILLWSAGRETIGVMVFNLQESGNTTESAALAVLMMTVLIAGNLLARQLTGGKLGY